MLKHSFFLLGEFTRRDFKGRYAGSVLGFLKPYLDEQEQAFLDKNPAIQYIHYDWSLNAQEPLQ